MTQKFKNGKPFILYTKNGIKEEEEILLGAWKHVSADYVAAKCEIAIKAYDYWLKIPKDKLDAIIEILSAFYVTLAQVDDIEDNAPLRSGIITAHRIYSAESTLNTAIYSAFQVAEKVADLGHPEALRIFFEELEDTFIGQSNGLNSTHFNLAPTLEEYTETCAHSVTVLFKMPFRLMQLYSENEKDFNFFLWNLSFYHELRDDYCSVRKNEYTEKNTICEDLTEGKFNYVVVHAIVNGQDAEEIKDLLKLKTSDPAKIQQFVDLLEKAGSFAATRKKLEETNEVLRKEVERLGGNSFVNAILEKYLDWRNI